MSYEESKGTPDGDETVVGDDVVMVEQAPMTCSWEHGFQTGTESTIKTMVVTVLKE